MGIRQPSKTKAFLSQARAGAQKQQQARDELKKPALGGVAQAGTAMVQSGTQAQQSATQQVVSTGQQAAKDLTVDPTKVGTGMTTAVSGAPTASAPSAELKVVSGDTGTVQEVETSINNINTAIETTKNQITALDNLLQTAVGEDRAKLQAEKERLEKLVQDYRDKMAKENLGQIAGPSTFETEMLKQQQLLAGDAGDISKLASLFGGRKRKYGALEAQIYGKDLEQLQSASKEALTEKGLAEQAADVAEEEYQATLDESEKGYEKRLDTESEKLDVLTKTPAELVGYTRAKLIELFGDAKTVDSLFNFDSNGKVTSNKASKTREELVARKDQLVGEQQTGQSALDKAKTKQAEKEIAPYNDLLFGAVEPVTGERRGGAVKTIQDRMDKMNDYYKRALDDLNNRGTFSSYSGISSDKWRLGEIVKISKDYKTAVNNLETKLRQAQKDNDITMLKKAQSDINNLWYSYQQAVDEHMGKMKRRWQNPDAIIKIQ